MILALSEIIAFNFETSCGLVYIYKFIDVNVCFLFKNALDATVIFRKKKKYKKCFSSMILSIFNRFRQGICVSAICSQVHINAIILGCKFAPPGDAFIFQ